MVTMTRGARFPREALASSVSTLPGGEAAALALLVGHLADRVGREDGAVVEVRGAGPTRRYLVPDGLASATLPAAIARLAPYDGQGAPLVVLALGEAAEPTEDTWAAVVDGDRVSVRPAARAQSSLSADLGPALAAFIARLCERPDLALGAIAFASPEEIGASLAVSGSVGPPSTETVLGHLRRHPELRSARIVDRRGETTAGAILDAADRVALGLRARGLERGGVLGLHLKRTRDELVAMFAAWRLGVAFVPLDPKFPPARLAYMVETAGAKIVVSDGDLSALGPDTAFEVVRLDELDVEPTGMEAFVSPALDELAYVLYTSGSTGQPKGVAIAHGHITHMLRAMQEAPGFTRDDVICGVATFSFDPSLVELLMPFWVGSTLVMASEEDLDDGARLGALCDRVGATVLQTTPTRWRQLIDAGWAGGPRLKRMVGGEALTEDLASTLLAAGGELWNVYGPTEITVWATAKRVTMPQRGEVITVGTPLRDVTVRVVDRAGQPVPPGCAGELYIGGHGVGLGYRNREDLTRDRFVEDPTGMSEARMYRTGDGVRQRPDGELEFFGRLDSQVKVRGYRVELEEIEAQLRALAPIRNAAVAVHGRGGVETLVAFVVTDGSAIDARAIRAVLRERLPAYMVPVRVDVVPSLPMTPTGKLDRRALPEPAMLEESTSDGEASDLERQVREAVSESFALPSVGLDDDFTDFGGFSLARQKLVVALKKRGFAVDLPDVYQHTNARALARFIGDAPAGPRGEAPAAMPTYEVPGVGRGWPTTGLQRKIFLDVMASRVPGLWHVVHALAVHETVDTGRLRAAVERVFSQHAALRCSFHLLDDGMVVQVPRPAPGIGWREVGKAVPPGGVEELQRAELAEPCDPASGVINRFSLITTPDGDRILLWITHELGADAWSANLVLREIELAYGELSGRGPAYAGSERSFERYLERIHHEADRGRATAERLFGPPRVDAPAEGATRLPAALDALRGRLGVPREAVRRLEADDMVIEPMPFAPGLAEAAKRFDATPSLIVQAALVLGLMRSGEESLRVSDRQVAYGVYLASRTEDEGRAVGRYTNCLPHLVELPPSATVRDWLRSMRRGLRDLLSVESVDAGEVMRRLPARAVDRAAHIHFADDGYPWFLGEGDDDERIFDFLAPFTRLGCHLSVMAMMTAPNFLVFTYDGREIAEATAHAVHREVFAMGARLVAASGDEPLGELIRR